MPAGRPTDFRPEFGEAILDAMDTGLSLTAAAATINVHRQRVYEWAQKHPEFADAVKMGQAKRQLFLETRLLGAAEGAKVTAAIFALKNANPEEWRDKHDVEHSGQVAVNFQTIYEPEPGGNA